MSKKKIFFEGNFEVKENRKKVKQEADIYKFCRVHANKSIPMEFVEKELGIDLTSAEKIWASLNIYIILDWKNLAVIVQDFIAMSKEDFRHIPDDSILPFYTIDLPINESLYVVPKRYIPFYMLKEYGGFIPEFPKLFCEKI